MRQGLMRRSCRMPLAGIAVCAAFAATTAPAGATVTVGSPLTAAFAGYFQGIDTEANLALSGPGAHVSSPVNGTVVRYRVMVGPTLGSTALRVMRPAAAGAFTGAGTSTAVTPAAVNTTQTFSTNLPIHAGDLVGLDLITDLSSVADEEDSTPGSNVGEWNAGTQTLLADGATAPPDNLYPGQELGFNADVVPSNEIIVGVRKSNKKKGTATLELTLPNAGTLKASGKGVRASSTAKAAAAQQVAAGPVKLRIKASGKKRKALSATGKVRLKVALTYTPAFGDARKQSVKVKLKKG